MLGSWNKSAGGGKHMGWVPSLLYILSSCHFLVYNQVPLSKWLKNNPLIIFHFVILIYWYSSELVQRVAINDIAESIMAFNTNYKDTGLFGVYAVAKVSSILFSFVSKVEESTSFCMFCRLIAWMCISHYSWTCSRGIKWCVLHVFLHDDVPWPCFVGWLLGWFGFCNYARDEQIIIQGYRRGCYSCTQSGISFNEDGISFNVSSMCSSVSYGLLRLNSMKHIVSFVC